MVLGDNQLHNGINISSYMVLGEVWPVLHQPTSRTPSLHSTRTGNKRSPYIALGDLKNISSRHSPYMELGGVSATISLEHSSYIALEGASDHNLSSPALPLNAQGHGHSHQHRHTKCTTTTTKWGAIQGGDNFTMLMITYDHHYSTVESEEAISIMNHLPIYLPFHWALRLLTPVTHSKFHPASTTTAEMVEASLMQILICLIYYLISWSFPQCLRVEN